MRSRLLRLWDSILPAAVHERNAQRLRLERFRSEYDAFSRMQREAGRDMVLDWQDRFPCLDDATGSTPFDKHYLFHLAWAARIVAATRPQRHVDVSSALQFACIVSAFVPTEYYELRPVALGLDGLTTATADLVRLPFADRSVNSVSCMHVVEHVGLGRYGDALDPMGDLNAMSELKRVLAPGGNLLFVVPVGKPRIQFNAHRVYGYDQVMKSFADLELIEFALITDQADPAGLVRGASPALVASQSYGCGCFWFRRAAA
jgi:SAM-dependent methyltransferase